MLVSIEIRGEICRVTCVGDFNFATFADAMEKMVSHPGFISPMNCLWDCRAADATSMSTDDPARMIAFMKGSGGRRGLGRTAVVAEGDLEYGMSRMYSLLSEGTLARTFHVFRTMELAEAWLTDSGAPPDL